MATLNAVGACQTGFSLLLSSRLYRIFIRPKFEYGLAILPLKRTDTIQLEKIRDKCLHMMLPGTSKNCPCGTDHISRRHLAVCSLVPAHLLVCLPIPSDQNCNPIDFAITALPNSSQAPCPSYWVALLTILWHFDKLCNPDGDYTHKTHFGTL
ncbi:hypothetical protein PHYBLDRAFT_168945 [Phycomyces blakesleeanus NRRL 1555(-)]|uniref:Uncharacterized protein n=1 Tax=Phycomyces blakesleeanus (strain ATCC 8743b / DSM 1359 / FGSC 10004 / NBRC 33097 / NRRL 1555) TaxID=763407 RepID=A0A163DPA2_PHYB8|nr:hypothetical protein PHYBLDRAFT_168945 [Phycomyces blakesleeanus NRRL 1555(-)]OAD72680.1 hypothetical protein PHYBLDRAFT_168945 [Phycomyces blakesleeanus NRRL 1555(-)]|eukprot:XP_018290720.1 hypothetical protein PHYBLDRAFT_168945 [Phycomyces blakesleeanus NRRL 1555(-)]